VALRDILVQVVLAVQLEILVKLAPVVQVARLDLVAILEIQAIRDRVVRPDQPDQLVRPALLVKQDQQDRVDLLVPVDLAVQLAQLETVDRQALVD